MKKYVWLGLVAATVFCCKNSGVDKKDEGLKYKETVTINDVPKATLTFFDVVDSRCPEGVTCIWGGNATVDLLLSGVTTEGGVNEHVKLCIGTCDAKVAGDTLVRNFAGQQYRFVLQDVKPYPKVEQGKKEDYRILLKIEKK
ncbi:hypothetical protein [Dyadobacter sp. CY323]|uniref:hypothetical protein n=1 Tax=Dyadobacter sp. CY323 TaxID=2907302 RepID=UPI001F3668B3|nr:hypothetical protein [Dyadobacter sp. CY323]MCE6992691.1 hypothetical protein [Dyadobacter sp. CY323]